MRRPIQDHQSAPANHFACFVHREPAHVVAGLQLLRHPRREMLCHHIEYAIIGAARVHKHAPAMVSDDGGVSSGGGAGSGHIWKYRPRL